MRLGEIVEGFGPIVILLASIVLQLISVVFSIFASVISSIFGYGSGRGNAYSLYIASSEWKGLASRIRFQRGNRCESCGTNRTKLDVHHLTYARLGHEKPGDLQVLCRNCHETKHSSGFFK